MVVVGIEEVGEMIMIGEVCAGEKCSLRTRDTPMMSRSVEFMRYFWI